MTNVKVDRKDVISDQEVNQMLAIADKFPSLFFKLRAKATLAFLETGKRRSEIASLERSDITMDSKFLYVRFTVVKKRKKNLRTLQRIKKFAVESQWTRYIIEYFRFLESEFQGSKYVYPSIRYFFGKGYVMNPTEHAKPQEVWRIIKKLNEEDWPHQHREKRAVKVIRADESRFGECKLETVYRVRNALDLERETTAYNYIRRFETQKVEEEEETIA